MKRDLDESAVTIQRKEIKTGNLRCANEYCTICDGSEWKEMHPDESPDITRSIRNYNAKLACSYLHKKATALNPTTDEIVKGTASECHLLECGDPLFRFVCDNGTSLFVHEVELVEEE